MSIADDLKKLGDMHAAGELTDEEFEQAKKALLTGGPPQASNLPRYESPRYDAFRQFSRENPDDSLGRAANRYVSLRIAMAIIGLILFILFFFGVFAPAMHRGSVGFPSGGNVRFHTIP